MPKRGRRIYRLSGLWRFLFGRFFVIVLETLFKTLFVVPNRLFGPIWVHFRVIFRSISCLFLDIVLFEKHAFRPDQPKENEEKGGKNTEQKLKD